MGSLALLAGLVVAAVGQWLNRYPTMPAPVVKLVLLAIGAGLYAWAHPAPALSGQPFMDWLEVAIPWSAGLPGVASLIGTLPGMGTNSQGGAK